MHSFTKNPEQITSQADIVVSDVGIPNLVQGNWLKPGAVVIDMGTNLVKVRSQKLKFYILLLSKSRKLISYYVKYMQ